MGKVAMLCKFPSMLMMVRDVTVSADKIPEEKKKIITSLLSLIKDILLK